MNHWASVIFISFFLIIYTDIDCQTSKFKDAIKNPIHHTPHFFPETYDQEGFSKLLDSLIRWEMTRSMYDWNFSSALGQIKTLSISTKSEYGLAMFHYFEGMRRGIGDPLNAENNFLKALNYFENQKDTSGILHTSMHLFRMSLNTTMLEIGNLSRHYDLYNKVLQIGSKSIEPFDQVVYLRNIILYDEYICGVKHVEFYKGYIEQALSIEKILESKYDYYKFLIYNTVGIIYSKSRKHTESEYWHEKGYEIISKYPSLELQMAAYRLAAMKYETGKYDESLCLLDQTRKHMFQNNRNKTLVNNIEAHAFMRKLYLYNYYQKKDTVNQKIFLEATFNMFINNFFIGRHKLYMQDMAAVHKNEKNTSIIIENEKKQSRQTLIISLTTLLIFILIVFTYRRILKQKKLEKELIHKNFIYSMVGHDLSSPMIAIEMVLDDIIVDLDEKLNDNQKKYLHKIKSASQGAYLLLNNLLNLYKQDAGFSTKLNQTTPTPIKDEIDTSIKHLFNDKLRRSVQIENKCPDHIIQPIDRPSFQCVIRNIVDNALKHSMCDTITFDTDVKHNYMVITITNNGAALPQDIVEIFNQDKSIVESSLSKTKIGLGTIFIMEFVHALKSTLSVYSNEDETKFIWSIPIR